MASVTVGSPTLVVIWALLQDRSYDALLSTCQLKALSWWDNGGMSEDMSQAMCELLYCQGDVFKGLKKKNPHKRKVTSLCLRTLLLCWELLKLTFFKHSSMQIFVKKRRGKLRYLLRLFCNSVMEWFIQHYPIPYNTRNTVFVEALQVWIPDFSSTVVFAT